MIRYKELGIATSILVAGIILFTTFLFGKDYAMYVTPIGAILLGVGIFLIYNVKYGFNKLVYNTSIGMLLAGTGSLLILNGFDGIGLLTGMFNDMIYVIIFIPSGIILLILGILVLLRVSKQENYPIIIRPSYIGSGVSMISVSSFYIAGYVSSYFIPVTKGMFPVMGFMMALQRLLGAGLVAEIVSLILLFLGLIGGILTTIGGIKSNWKLAFTGSIFGVSMCGVGASICPCNWINPQATTSIISLTTNCIVKQRKTKIKI